MYCRNEDSGDKWYNCLIPGCLKKTDDESGAKSKWYDCLIPGCLKDVQCCSCQIPDWLEQAERGKSFFENLLVLVDVVRLLLLWLLSIPKSITSYIFTIPKCLMNIPNKLEQAKRGRSCFENIMVLVDVVRLLVLCLVPIFLPAYDVVTDCIAASDHFK